MRKLSRALYILGFLLASLALQDVVVLAQGSSNSYRIDESFIGPGGSLESNSGGFTLEAGRQSLGNAGGVVNGISSNYGTQGGYTTTADPSLICIVDTPSINFGYFSTSTTATANAVFRVLNYTAYGYNVVMLDDTPSEFGGHHLAAMSSTATSQTGTEQFGINLVANTSPAVFGSFPEQIPDSSFSFGDASANYSSSDNYRYVPGEVVASSPKSSGETRYTISYIVNISNDTPRNSYSGNQTILCTGTY